jgi:hypothetical protein
LSVDLTSGEFVKQTPARTAVVPVIGEEEQVLSTEGDENVVNKKHDHMMLSSYTYSNCPFTMAKFSQYQLAKEGPFTSGTDKRINSPMRADMALDLSNNAKAYARVTKALQNHAFNRTILLDGDSLTRQLFISVGCLLWSAGYVEDYILGQYVYNGGTNTILKNVNYTASSKNFGAAHVKVKGGGEIYYISNPSKEKIDGLSKRMVHDACDAKKEHYKARYSFGQDLLPMKKKDVVVLAAGHHKERSSYISAYKHFFQCINDEKSNGTKAFTKWPHFFYQLSSVESFWTEDGMYGSPRIPDKDMMSCQPTVPSAVHRQEEREEFGGLVPFIADDVDVKKLGEYHVEHGDCLHWIQPGVPDLYAAQLADFLITITERTL